MGAGARQILHCPVPADNNLVIPKLPLPSNPSRRRGGEEGWGEGWIATQVLRDGDLVEVDAEKGVVKKL